MKYPLGMISCALAMALAAPSQASNGLLWRNKATGSNYLYSMQGTDINQKKAINVVEDKNWNIATTGDFDGDGESDILWRHAVSGLNHIYLMQAGAIKQGKDLNTVSDLQWQVAASADFNGDGKDDVLWRNASSGQNVVYLMNGLSKSATVTLSAMSSAWTVAGVGDFNQDGVADVLWRNQTSGDNRLMLMSQGKDSTVSYLNNVSSDWQVAAVADFSADGVADVLWRNSKTGDNYLHLVAAGKVASISRINNVPLAWNIAAAIDLNDDQYADIVWRNSQTGTNYAYLMKGATIETHGAINRVADVNWELVSGVKVKQSTAVTPSSIVIMPDSALSLEPGDSFDLTAKGTYSNDTEEVDPSQLVWTSSDPSVASVDANGLVVAKAAGDATITVSWQGTVVSEALSVSVDVIPEPFKVYFKKPSGWGSCYIYYWGSDPVGTKSAAWPGESMTATDDGWCIKEFSEELTSINVIFNDNGATQTGDFESVTGGCLLDDLSTWLAEGDGECNFTNSPRVGATPAGGSFYDESGISVSLKVAGENVTQGYYKLFDGQQQSSAQSGTAYQDGSSVTVGQGLALNEQQTLCLYAANSEESVNECYTYTRIEKPEGGVFSWDNATVYFVITDRFYDADPSNNNSYGRERDQSGNIYEGYQNKLGTFHGGDLKGLTVKLNEGYFTDLGVNAIWVTAPYEQIHGYVSGAGFKHYAYHGYYVLDFSEIDQNMGTEDDLRTFIDTAHEKGIRVIFDIVMNHAGYDSMYDMSEFGYGTLNSGWESYYFTSNEGSVHYDNAGGFINRDDAASWANWWGADWLRAGVAGYPSCGSDDLTLCTSFLPDFRTENSQEVGIPPILNTKWSSAKKSVEEAELNAFFQRTGKPRLVKNYMIKWLTDWVREYGVDGFRVDTAKHVDMSVWQELKNEANSAYSDWKQNNPNKWADGQDLDFWMTGEVYDHGVNKSGYFYNGFDSLINFSFQGAAGNVSGWDALFSGYAQAINNDPGFNVLSYISSHDKGLFERGNLKNGITALLMSPGAVQIFYGDESGRPDGGSGEQGWRSHMNWGNINQDLLTHAQKLGQFRNRHIAVGAGSHTKLGDAPYYFSRVKDADKVVVALNATGQVSLDVSSVFADGTTLLDAYSNQAVTVSGGSVSLFADGYVLLEEQ